MNADCECRNRRLMLVWVLWCCLCFFFSRDTDSKSRRTGPLFASSSHGNHCEYIWLLMSPRGAVHRPGYLKKPNPCVGQYLRFKWIPRKNSRYSHTLPIRISRFAFRIEKERIWAFLIKGSTRQLLRSKISSILYFIR